MGKPKEFDIDQHTSDAGQVWFEERDGVDFRQGDVAINLFLPVLAKDYSLPEDPSDQEAVERKRPLCTTVGPRWIIVTPSCDLQQRSKSGAGTVLLSPCQIASETRKEQSSSDYRKSLEAKRRGFSPSHFVLPSFKKNLSMSAVVVDFQRIHAIPYSALLERSDTLEILRLQHPFREYFAQAAIGWLGRIGIEDDGHIKKIINKWDAGETMKMLDAQEGQVMDLDSEETT